jgi:ATP-dependent protease ClpP protease subunit
VFTYSYKTTKPEDDEDDEKKTIKRRPYHVYEGAMVSQQVHFYISDEIGEPGNYTDMIHRILVAGSHDVIFIHLNTPGGRLDTGVQIVNAMQNSQAKIITVLEGMAFSLGTLIFLAGDEMVVNDHCMMMFHNFRGGILGKGNEIVSQLEATIRWFSALAKKVYIPFLNEEEFERIIRGEDLWMHSPEIRKRLNVMITAAQAQTASTPKRSSKAKAKIDKPE